MSNGFSFLELQPEVKDQAQQAVEAYLTGYHYSEDNLQQYFEAFYLTRYPDHCLEISDLIDYCAATENHPEWVSALVWAKEYSINLIFNYETFEISWSDEAVASKEERLVYELIVTGESCLHPEDSTSIWDAYQAHLLTFETILDALREELKVLILYSIYPAVQDALTNELFDYLDGGVGRFTAAGDLLDVIDAFVA